MILQGDCLERLKELPADSVDALITDPPAGISFMGKAWDDDKGGRRQWIAWMTEVMAECHRVLKPGAHGLVWAIPRTSHWTGAALEDAGFEVRDVVTHLFGSGFPKSMDISKAIDKAAGAEREVLGLKLFADGQTYNGGELSGRAGMMSEGKPRGPALETAPATDDAKQWQGWGTALKPASEHWILVRKPCSEKTVAANVLKHGVGGINIDGCRVRTNEVITNHSRTAGAAVSKGKYGDSTAQATHQTNGQAIGRFPANLVLSHSPHCTEDACDMFECPVALLDEQSGFSQSSDAPRNNKNVGWKCSSPPSVVASPHNDSGGASRFFMRFIYSAKTSTSERNAGLDRSELVWESETWEKEDLNLRTENISQLVKAISESGTQLLSDKSWSTDLYGHSISEQYPPGIKSTIETVIRLITELKTLNCSHPLSTKESILGAIRTIEASGSSLADAVAFINQLSMDTIRGETAYLLSVVRAVLPELVEIRRAAKSGNFHSTVKPQKLMRYLCRLITPPKGTVLDPFMGSGSTGVAAKAEGFEFIGIEREPEYITIAEKRIDHVSQAP